MICIKPPAPLGYEISRLAVVHFTFHIVVVTLESERVNISDIIYAKLYSTFSVCRIFIFTYNCSAFIDYTEYCARYILYVEILLFVLNKSVKLAVFIIQEENLSVKSVFYYKLITAVCVISYGIFISFPYPMALFVIYYTAIRLVCQ